MKRNSDFFVKGSFYSGVLLERFSCSPRCHRYLFHPC